MHKEGVDSPSQQNHDPHIKIAIQRTMSSAACCKTAPPLFVIIATW